MISHAIRITSAELCTPLENVAVSMEDKNGSISSLGRTNELGILQINFKDKKGKLIFEKEGFTSKESSIKNLSDVIRLLEDQIIGYQEKLGYSPGEKVTAFIHSSKPYSATLYRHGLKKLQVLKRVKQKQFKQEVPDGFFVEHGINWKPSLTYRIPGNAETGLFSLLLEPEQGEPFAIPFIVSTREADYGKKSKLLVLASTNTWISYNMWGGRNRYRNYEQAESGQFLDFSRSLPMHIIRKIVEILPWKLRLFYRKILNRKQPAWKFKPMSVRRPFTNCRLEEDDPQQPFTNHLAGGEWRLLAWLERENIPYDMVTGFDLHRNPGLLKNYKAVILSTHCEYWSREMYDGLKDAHFNHGLWILNLSGNSIYREIGFLKDGSTHCKSLFFHRSCEDETQLLGVRFTETDYGTCAPFKITEPDHWIFRNCLRDKKRKIFGEQCLNRMTEKNYNRYDPGRPGLKTGLTGTGASGWEMDKLSRTAPRDFVRVAKGLNRRGGADMVVKDPDVSRGGVFSASSITFTGSLLVDDICSGIVKNVFHKAGLLKRQ